MLARILFAPDAPLSDKLLGVWFILIFAGFFFLLGWGILKVLRSTKSIASDSASDIVGSALRRTDQRMAQHQVSFTFTTYTGFVLWVVQSTGTYTLPFDVAEEVLRKLLRHNCTWGLLGPGLVFVPFLSLAEYWQRKREIAQQREAFAPVMKDGPPNDGHSGARL